jgi:hypothetical protein
MRNNLAYNILSLDSDQQFSFVTKHEKVPTCASLLDFHLNYEKFKIKR